MKKMPSDLKIDSSSQVIKSNNKELFFKINRALLSKNKIQKIISQNIIKIENITSCYVALRVQTTKKDHYAVQPIYSIIAPNSFINIKIAYHSTQNEEITSIGHKFRFEGFIIDEKEKNTKNIMGLFQKYIDSQKIVKGNIIKKNVILFDYNKKAISAKDFKCILSQNKTTINIDNPLRSINKNKLDLNEKLEQEIKKCNELKSIYKNLMKNLEEINIKEKTNIDKDKNSILDKIKIGKELISKIRNNKLYLISLICLFLSSTIFGFYLAK